MVRRVRRGSSPHIVRLVTAGVLASASPSGLRAQVGPQSQPPKQPKAAQQALVKGEGAESVWAQLGGILGWQWASGERNSPGCPIRAQAS